MKILIYGNDPMMRKVKAMLDSFGEELIELNGNIKELPDNQEFSLAVVDMNLQDAPEVCEYLKKTWDLPIVILLGFGEEGWGKVDDVDVDGYIHRSIPDGELAARLKALQRRIARAVVK